MEASGLGALLPEMRLDFWDSFWQGQITNIAALKRRLSVLELPVTVDAPCCRCVLRLRHGDAYLDQIWRYGRDRLRVAVGNLLPHEDKEIFYAVCRLTPRHVYIIASAMEGIDAGALEMRTRGDIESLIQQLEQYLDLESELKEIIPLASLAELTRLQEG